MADQESQDKTIQCSTCSKDFVFAAGEQLYYKDRDFDLPKRCPSCRTEKRRQSNENQNRRDR